MPGQNNLPGFDGSVSTHLVGQSFGVGNGDFSDGLALYRRSGGGSTQIVDVAGNAVADVMTDAGGGPTTLTQLVTTQGNSPLRLAFDYRFLTNAGIFQVLLDNTLLATLPAVQLADFSHFDLVLTDPALRGLDVADLNLRLLPGSIAEVQLDNVVFQPAVALAGDYNNNGIVDAADYVVWRKASEQHLHAGRLQRLARPLRPNRRQRLQVSSANAAVPEPATCVLLMFAAAGWCLRRRRAA